MKQIRAGVNGHFVDRIFLALVISLTILMSWVGAAYAETKTGIYVNPYGYYGAGYTNNSGDMRYSKSYWTAGYSIYDLYVNLRHWHIGNKEEEAINEQYNTTSTSEVSIEVGTYGNDTAQHYLEAASSYPGSVFYTSSGTGGDSTFYWWYCGNSSC